MLKVNAKYTRSNFGNPDPNLGVMIQFEAEVTPPEGMSLETSILATGLQGLLHALVARDDVTLGDVSNQPDPEELASERLVRQFS